MNPCLVHRIILYPGHYYLTSSPDSPIFFNVHKRKRGNLGSNITWQMLAWCHEKEVVNNHRFQISPPTSVYQTTVWGLQGSYDTRLKALAPYMYLPSTPNWSTWKYGLPTRNFHDPPPFLPLHMGPTSLTWRWIPGSPSFSRVRWKRSGSLGARLITTYWSPSGSISKIMDSN